MAEKVNDDLEAAIRKALDTYPRNCIVDKNTITIELCDTNITYKMLDNLSELLKTDSIDISSETREGGYCESCYYTYTVTVLTAYNCKLE